MQGKPYRLFVFDRPIVRDWAYWHAVGWAIAMGITAFVQPDPDSTAPLWVDVPGVAGVAFFMIGWTVAAIRRGIREVRSRASSRAGRAESSASRTKPAEAPPQAERLASPSPSGILERRAPHIPHEAKPVSLGSYSDQDFRTSTVLEQSRQDMPYPVARAARAVQTTQDPLEQYQYLLDLGESLTLTLGMLSASWLRQHAPSNPALDVLHRSYLHRGVSQGHWHEVIKAAEKAMVRSDAALDGFVEGVRSRKNDHGVLDALKEVLAERNRAAHGARPHNRAEASVRARELAPLVLVALERARFLRLNAWVLVESLSFRRHDRSWDARVRLAMGDHPEFDLQTRPVRHPLANDTFYVMTESVALDLTPMLVLRYCEQCRQPEVCHADRVDPGAGVSLKSFARGHQVFDSSLLAEIETLASIARQ